MKQITIVSFRGTGFRHTKYKKEPGLVRAGHVGFIFEDEPETIYGFHPTQEAEDKAGGLNELIELLKKHERQPGTVQNDTEVFDRAYELAEQGELDRRTEVYQLTYELEDDAYQTARKKVLDLHETQEEMWYNFPYKDGRFAEDECNCAIFPGRIGIPIPSTNGMVSEYIEEMRRQGAKVWQPPKL